MYHTVNNVFLTALKYVCHDCQVQGEFASDFAVFMLDIEKLVDQGIICGGGGFICGNMQYIIIKTNNEKKQTKKQNKLQKFKK